MIKKNYFLLIISALFILGCKSTLPLTKHRTQRQFLPAELRNVYLTMPLDEARKARPKMSPIRVSEDFRIEFMEAINKDHIETVTYYFDQEGSYPLYELIVDFDTRPNRDLAAAQLFGPPNWSDSEWMKDSKEGFMIHAWPHQDKLVIVGKIAGTEWEE